MIGWLMLRSAIRTSKKVAGGSSKPRKPEVPWSTITKSHAGQWAIVIFAGLFIMSVVLVGWYIDYANTHY